MTNDNIQNIIYKYNILAIEKYIIPHHQPICKSDGSFLLRFNASHPYGVVGSTGN